MLKPIISNETESMGTVRVQIKLTNAINEALIRRGLLNPDMLRVCQTEALIDIGAVRTVLPRAIVTQLGLNIRSQQMAQFANGTEEPVGLTKPVIIEIDGRETTEATPGHRKYRPHWSNRLRNP